MSSVIRLNNQVNTTANQTFTATSSVQTFTVPSGIFWIRFFLWGAGGIGQNGGINVNSAGGGAFVEGNLRTAPGTVYYIVVGARGRYNITPTIANGGAAGGGTGADGGGFSGIFSSTPSVSSVIAIAGGGGGAGFNGNGYGGGGGFPSGGTAQGGSPGGSQTAGGSVSFAGSQFLGGVSGFGGDCCGGGGGGGWFGGGGGNNSQGGGGGSSTVTSLVINPILENGTNGSPTGVTPTPPGGRTSPAWISPLGSAGQTGLVVIGYNANTGSIPISIISTASIAPLGGTITVVGARTFHTFRANGTVILPSAKRVEIFAIGGGGGGGFYVAGGGASGALQNPTLNVAAGSYAITIGEGCNGGVRSGSVIAQVGGNTTVGTLVTATGGGYGGSYGSSPSGNGGAFPGGGGGGLGGSGVIGSFNEGTWTGGAGGIGITYYGNQYGGGGGGGGQFSADGVGTFGGGTGAGSGNDSGNTASPGTANTGGGGGGGFNGGKGGSGIVIISYESIPKFAASQRFIPMQITQGNVLSTTGTTFINDNTTYTFPANVGKVRVFIWGGGGGNRGGSGAHVAGDIVKGTMTTLTIYVNRGRALYGPGGGVASGGFGAVHNSTNGYLMIAGAGGTGSGSLFGGGGGYLQGFQGGSSTLPSSKTINRNYSNGGGGSQTQGGQGGFGNDSGNYISGAAGGYLQGGDGNRGSAYGQGGGGGYYGGGGGNGDANGGGFYTGNGAGGGGSSYINPGFVRNYLGEDGKNGSSTSVTPGGTSSPFYQAGYGVGALSGAGGNALVVIVPYVS